MAENRGVDSELNFKAVAVSAVVLLAVCFAAFALMWGVAVWQKKRLVAQDPPPPVLAEARVKSLPAGPLLQSDPEEDLKTLRAREDAVLSSWAWADPTHKHARVPADRALEIVATKGFPPRTAPPPAPVPAPAPAPEVKK
jgi:hypothetical protein